MQYFQTRLKKSHAPASLKTTHTTAATPPPKKMKRKATSSPTHSKNAKRRAAPTTILNKQDWMRLADLHSEPGEIAGGMMIFSMCQQAGFFFGFNKYENAQHVPSIIECTGLARDAASLVAAYLPAFFDHRKEQACKHLIAAFCLHMLEQQDEQDFNITPSGVDSIQMLFTREGVVVTTILLFENDAQLFHSYATEFLSFSCLLVLYLYGQEGLEYCMSVATIDIRNNKQFEKATSFSQHALLLSEALSISAEAQSHPDEVCVAETPCFCQRVRKWWMRNSRKLFVEYPITFD